MAASLSESLSSQNLRVCARGTLRQKGSKRPQASLEELLLQRWETVQTTTVASPAVAVWQTDTEKKHC